MQMRSGLGVHSMKRDMFWPPGKSTAKTSALPPGLSASYSRLERFGLPLLIGLIFLDSQYRILDPLYRFTLRTVSQLFSF